MNNHPNVWNQTLFEVSQAKVQLLFSSLNPPLGVQGDKKDQLACFSLNKYKHFDGQLLVKHVT